MKERVLNWLRVGAVMALALPAFTVSTASPALAQGNCRIFNETGKTVCDKFLSYWNDNGSLAQQGFPITNAMSEVSKTDGKIYTVQYFERSVFELHPEFANTPNEVLLQLLGVAYYAKKYPGGAPSQQANTEPGARLFSETGRTIGGKFQAYWESHGGLRQQGYPISDEFVEINSLDGKPYKVQYFERAVFEFHPEFLGTPNEVLLSQLGTFTLNDNSTPPTATPAPIPPTNTPGPVPPTATPAPPQSTPTTPPASGCAALPPANPDVASDPATRCGPRGTIFYFAARGFQPNESVGVYLTAPDGSVIGANFQLDTDGDGYTLQEVVVPTSSSFPAVRVAITFEGVESHVRQVEYFQVLP